MCRVCNLSCSWLFLTYVPQISGITVGGKDVTLQSGGVANFDTGTGIIAGPTPDVAAIYAQIPNSQPLSGDYTGYYGFRMLVFLVFKSLPDVPFAS